MNFKYNMIAAVAILLLSVQCANSQQSNVKVLSVKEFSAKSSQEGIVLLDVRTDAEFAQGKIKGATQIDFNSPEFDNQIAQLDKNKSYMVYCAGGTRSSKAVKKMAALGFKEVYDLDGGMRAWISAGMPVD